MPHLTLSSSSFSQYLVFFTTIFTGYIGWPQHYLKLGEHFLGTLLSSFVHQCLGLSSCSLAFFALCFVLDTMKQGRLMCHFTTLSNQPGRCVFLDQKSILVCKVFNVGNTELSFFVAAHERTMEYHILNFQ